MNKITTIILNGGLATRMIPLSLNKNKCMISFLGKPLLFYLLHDLKSNGFSEIVSTSEGQKGEIKEYFSDGKKFGINIRYNPEIKVCGTASIIKAVLTNSNFNVSDPFMVIYGDSLLKANYKKIIEFHEEKNSFCTILYHKPEFDQFQYEYLDYNKKLPNLGPRTNYGILDIDRCGRITRIEEKCLLSDIKTFKNPVANAALYILDKNIYKVIPNSNDLDFSLEIFPLLINEGYDCYGLDIKNGYRFDIGTISNYYKTQIDIINKKINLNIQYPLTKEKTWIGSGLKLDPSIKIEAPVLICDNYRIGNKSNIYNSIIGNNVSIKKNTTIRNSIILDNVIIGKDCLIKDSIIGENANINPGEIITSGSVISENNTNNSHFIFK